MYQIIYCSKAVGFEEDVLADIFKESVNRNFTNDIRGFLFVVNNNSFVQILQGPLERVNYLFNKISNDKRHHDVNLISVKKIEVVNLNYWNIRILIDNDHNIELSKLWEMTLDENGFVNPRFISEKLIFDTIFYRKIEFDNFQNCLYDFKLVSDVFNVMDVSNSLELLQTLNLYHNAYDNYKKSNSVDKLNLLNEIKTKLEQLVYKKHEKSRS